MEARFESELQRLETDVDVMKKWKVHVDSLHEEFATALREIKELLQEPNSGETTWRSVVPSISFDKRTVQPAEVNDCNQDTYLGCVVEADCDDITIDKPRSNVEHDGPLPCRHTHLSTETDFDYSPLWDEDEVRPNQESIWDAALFIGLGMGWPESTFVFILFIVNLSMQMLLAQVISEMAYQPNLMITEDGLQGLLLWRLSLGHHASTYDEFTDSNLVTRVCNQYLGLITADRYARTQSSFSEYLRFRLLSGSVPRTDLLQELGLKLGEFLCLGALLIWVTIVCLELRDIFKTMLAWMSIPRHRTTILRRDPNGGSGLSFVSMAWVRCVCLWVCVIVPRFLVALVLLMVGSDFLINTASVSELILNAVALSFVFDMDELFYQFTPPVCHKLVIHTEPLPVNTSNIFRLKMSSGFRRHITGVIDMAFATLTLIIWLLYYFNSLREVVSGIDEASKIICGGKLDFVYTTNRATGLVYYSREVAANGDLSARDLLSRDGINGTVLTLAMSAALQLTGLGELGLPTVERLAPEVTGDKYTEMSHVADRDLVNKMYREGLGGAMQRLQCEDMDRDPAERYALYSKVVLEHLRHAPPESPNMTSCADIASLCSSAMSRTLARTVCPATCGCAHLYAGSFDVDGCPPSCQPVMERELRDMALAVRAVNSEGCVDMPTSGSNLTAAASTTLGEGWWQRYFWQLQVHVASRGLLEAVEDETSWPVTAELQLAVLRRTARRYKLINGARVDLVAMAGNLASSMDASPCIMEFFAQAVFDLDLCGLTLDDGSWFGTIAGLCPMQCELCVVQAEDSEELPLGMEGRHWSWAKLLRLQLEYNMSLVEETPPSKIIPLDCRGTRTITVNTETEPDYGFLPGPDALFTIDVTSSRRYYTLDLCGKGTMIDTKLRVLRTPWRQAMDYYPELLIREDDDSCGYEGRASSLMLTGLEPGKYLVWIDGPSVAGGQIEVSYRCTWAPLYWEVTSGRCSLGSMSYGRSCVAADGGVYIQGTDMDCEFRVFPDAWRVRSMVLYPNGPFRIPIGDELLVPTAGGVISNSNSTFTAIGHAPTGNLVWKRRSIWPMTYAHFCFTSTTYGTRCYQRSEMWEICTQPFSQQPWQMTEAASPGLIGCERAFVDESDCISNNRFDKLVGTYFYPPNERCRFEVIADWRTLRGPDQGINFSAIHVNTVDKLEVDKGTNTSREYSGDGDTFQGAIIDHNVVWRSTFRHEEGRQGWTLCVRAPVEEAFYVTIGR